VKSHVGAIGRHAVDARHRPEQKVGDITQLEPNIPRASSNMRFNDQPYYKDEPMTPLNKALMTFASYPPAGPHPPVAQGGRRKRGLDKNVGRALYTRVRAAVA